MGARRSIALTSTRTPRPCPTPPTATRYVSERPARAQQAWWRLSLSPIALQGTHVLHASDAPTIGKGKAQPGIEQRLHIPLGEVGTEVMAPVDNGGYPGREQVQRAQADDSVGFLASHIESAHGKYAGLQPIAYGQRRPTPPNQ